ncbi:hypothetical protein BRADI_2g30841v3 [Brachypodium distachyon]|uniref:Reverse transcriptase zinc-binding domain-containing protein n=1 Tax=Brachypodium distachyon TaxID=15368 RepID=A0A2K2DBA3_BRADI|nr:hypothetical protein BRADI_2g30841v3 [Brachypodium distachyon]
MQQKRGLHLQSCMCTLCNLQILETRNHLFFECPFALSCWRYLCPDFDQCNTVHGNIHSLKTKLKVPFHMEIMILAAWSIWKIRNEFILKGITLSLYRCQRLFKEELNLMFHRAKRKNYHALASCMDRSI